jgi:hypothetical protein
MGSGPRLYVSPHSLQNIPVLCVRLQKHWHDMWMEKLQASLAGWRCNKSKLSSKEHKELFQNIHPLFVFEKLLQWMMILESCVSNYFIILCSTHQRHLPKCSSTSKQRRRRVEEHEEAQNLLGCTAVFLTECRHPINNTTVHSRRFWASKRRRMEEHEEAQNLLGCTAVLTKCRHPINNTTVHPRRFWASRRRRVEEHEEV